MCGRFSLTATPEDVALVVGTDEFVAFPPRYNIAPTQPILMVSVGPNNKLIAPLVRWGLVPAWVKDPNEFSLLVNARSETAAQKPSFRNAMRHRRTLIPASGFYEWFRPANAKGNEGKQAYWIRPKHGGIVYFGGIMETWASADGSEIDSGCILTTSANEAISQIHHRMPVIIQPDDFERWLDCKTNEPRDIVGLLKPAPNDFFEAIAVSDLVNNVRNSGAEVQTPQAEQPAPVKSKEKKEATTRSQMDLF